MIRDIQISEPGYAPVGFSRLYIDIKDRNYKKKDFEGFTQFITGVTGVVAVEKVIRDAALEAPGEGLDSESPGQRYVIITNGQDGARDDSWGAIEGSQGTMLIERSADNFEWLVQVTPAMGTGNLAVFDRSDSSLWIYTGQGWRRFADGTMQIGPILSAPAELVAGTINRITGSDTYTLPPAGQYKGQTVEIKFLDNSTSGPTIEGTGGELIDGIPSITISESRGVRRLTSDGLGWMVM